MRTSETHLEQIDVLLSSLREAGVGSVFVEHLNASHSLRARIASIAEKRYPASYCTTIW